MLWLGGPVIHWLNVTCSGVGKMARKWLLPWELPRLPRGWQEAALLRAIGKEF